MTVVCFFVSRSEEDQQSLAYAAELAFRHNQGLRVVCAMPDLASSYVGMAPEFGMAVSAIVPQELMDKQAVTVERSKADFERIIAASSLPSDHAIFASEIGFLPQLANDEAILADICVFPAEASVSGHHFSSAFIHVLTNAGLPVVLSGAKEQVGAPVLIAWDGSEQAARSLRFHFPLISLADEVIIAHCPEKLKYGLGSEQRSPVALQEWLKNKGVKSRIAEIHGGVGQGLLDIASATQAGLIVSGAYGHNRLGEHIFGGVTKTLLDAKSTPALALCH